MKKATDEDFVDPLLQSALEAAFAQYILKTPTSDIKSDKKTTYIYGLLAMTYATQNVQTRTIVQHGYSQWCQKGGAIDFFYIRRYGQTTSTKKKYSCLAMAKSLK